MSERSEQEPLAGLLESAAASGSLVHAPLALLHVTFDQLRTLVVLHETRSPLKAASALHRDQSSVQKQLATLNSHFATLCGEQLARPMGRGKELSFTRTGDLVARLGKELLDDWLRQLQHRRRELGESLSVGATSFILDFVPETWTLMVRTLEDSRVRLSIRQIRTREVLTALGDKDAHIDAVLGGVILEQGTHGIDDPLIDFLEWNRQPFALLTNYSKDRLSEPSVSPEILQELPLLLPGPGIIDEFLTRWYGADYRKRLKTYEVEGDVLFNLSLLRSGSVEGCIIVPAFIADSNYAYNLRSLSLSAPGFPDLHVVAGLLVRKGDREDFPSDHPINTVWELFSQEVARQRNTRKKASKERRRSAGKTA